MPKQGKKTGTSNSADDQNAWESASREEERESVTNIESIESTGGGVVGSWEGGGRKRAAWDQLFRAMSRAEICAMSCVKKREIGRKGGKTAKRKG